MKGRRSTKPVERRKADFLAACRRSGFAGSELLQILLEWYGWSQIEVSLRNGTTFVAAILKGDQRSKQ